jgi:DNA invertase Pin-like site-specific DNA recombinase
LVDLIQNGYAAMRAATGLGEVFTGEDSPMADLRLSVMGAFAEFERHPIRERQREGIALAKQRGAYKAGKGL